ncbi:uncharacterized protein A4U43_C01F36240 [Asparagus officinalis]|uniref:DYW domain-containing protein n=1 Tax=Asparagus officinalis TaxID=4686 RepID=A0A5P1FVH5_ASPOF|nr:uncharacterized protein A4U43_C01F36240 [Asparagus officinalis]
MYLKCGVSSDGDEMGRRDGIHPNLVTWNGLVAGFNHSGNSRQAVLVLRRMRSQGFSVDGITVSCVLSSVADFKDENCSIAIGAQIHGHALKAGFLSSDGCVVSSLIGMYGKCCRSEEMIRVFDDYKMMMDVGSYNALLTGLSRNGRAEEALASFRGFQGLLGIQLNVVSWTSIVACCAQNGRDMDALDLFREMQLSGGVKPNLLGEVAAEKLFYLEPGNAGNYVLLSNIYASKGMWSGVDRMRDKLKSMGMKKEAGCSWIEVKNMVHMLLAGDKSHPQMGQIIERLEKLSTEMKRLGYSPGMNFVLQDLEDQEEKEHILCGHSEKLALALGLINTTHGTPLRVIKNLRICGDCHTFFKFVSGFERREIIVRDTNRFHQFTDGCCSCGDYWYLLRKLKYPLCGKIIAKFSMVFIQLTDGTSNFDLPGSAGESRKRLRGALDVEGDSDRKPIEIEVAPSPRGTRDRRRVLADSVDAGFAGESSPRPGPSRRPGKEPLALANEVDGADESSPGPGGDIGEGSLKEMSSNDIHQAFQAY